MIKLIDGSNTRHKKGTYYKIQCRLCKSNKTKIQSNGEPIWIKNKDVSGNWNNQYICYKCFYEQDKICYKCKLEQIVKSINMIKHYDNNGLWSGKYICNDCYNKSKVYHRNRDIILTIKEDIGSIIDVVVAVILEIQTCSIYVGNKRLPFSLIHEYYGIIGIKTSKLKNNKWYFNINDYISADTYFCIGFDKDLRNIDVIYVISTEERMKSDGMLKVGRITISKNSNKYKKFEIDSTYYNHIYQNMDI